MPVLLASVYHGAGNDGSVSKRIDFSAYDSSYQLLEESRESWDHTISDEVIYLLQPIEVAPDSLIGIAKSYIEGAYWIECHVGFESNGHNYHFRVVIEADLGQKLSREVRKTEINDVGIDGYVPVLVNIAKQIQSPQKVASYGCGVPSVIRLQRFDDINCLCGYSHGAPLKEDVIRLSQNRKCGVFGVVPDLLCQGPHELIQGGAHAIEEIPDHKRNLVGDSFEFKPDDVKLVFKVILTPKGARLRFTEGPQPLPHVFKMFLRPGGFKIGIG